MLIGLHGDNREFWPEAAFQRLALARPDWVKLMTFNAPETFARVRAILPEAQIVVRLFWPGRPPKPERFVAKIGPKIEALLGVTEVAYWELLNEPNAPWEGFGPEGAKDFDAWALEVIPQLRARFPGIRLLWPALAVAPELKDLDWWRACSRSIAACDALAGHGYWQPEWAMEDQQWGLRFLVGWELYPDKELWVTEAGCTDPAVSTAQRASLYPRYALQLRELGVSGVAFWLLDGTSEWAQGQNAAFDDLMAEALARIPRQPPLLRRIQSQNTIKVGNLEGIIDLRERLPQRGAYGIRELGDIQYLVVHHSSVDVDSSAESIARYHVDKRGWPGIGYHFLVHWEGRIEYVGDILQARYNVARRNHEVLGVCLTGDFTNRWPSEAQLAAARTLLANIQYALGWPIPIVGHRDIALPGFSTACPGDTWPQWRHLVDAQGAAKVFGSTGSP